MTVRKIAGILPVLVAFALLQPLGAQETQAHEWTRNRPDAHGPVSLSEEMTLPAGEIQLAMKYLHVNQKGQGWGTDSLTVSQVLTLFDVAPSQLVTRGFAMDVLYGVTDHLTVAATGTFVQKKMQNLAGLEGQSNVYLFYQTSASGLQDVKLSALYNVYDQGAMRVHAHAGVSIPIGSVDNSAVTPFSEPSEAQLPYVQQLGSGTLDLAPGFTMSIQNEKASLGVQTKALIRLGDNDRGWSLGDYYEGNLWAGFWATDWASASIGLRYSNWGNVEGFDGAMDPNESPAHNTLTQAGWKVDLPVGLNFVMPPGRFAGHRLGVELHMPIHQDLDGPQFRHNWAVTVGWEKSFSF